MPNKLDPVEMLLTDHRKIRDLFRRWENAESEEACFEIAEDTLMELTVHSKLEEEVFYPVMQGTGDVGLQESIAHFYDDHGEVDALVEELKGKEEHDDDYETKFERIKDIVLHHMKEEEAEMLPRAREVLKDRAWDIASEMQARRMMLMAKERVRELVS